MIRSPATERVTTTLTADELALLREIAEQNASTLSALARRAIRRDLQRELTIREAVIRDGEFHDQSAITARRVADCTGDL
jgi:predicted transcriptional regulator